MTERRGKRLPADWRPDPAPGDLHLVQALVNTRGLERGDDELKSPEALSAWLSGHGLVPADTVLDTASWRTAIDVREGLRAVLRAHNSAPFDKTAIDHLNRALFDARLRPRFDGAGVPRLEVPDAGWAGAASRLLVIVFEAMGRGEWTRLKACLASGCQMAFYDRSRNRSGIWCSSRRCGNRRHVSTYRSRHPRRTK